MIRDLKDPHISEVIDRHGSYWNRSSGGDPLYQFDSQSLRADLERFPEATSYEPPGPLDPAGFRSAVERDYDQNGLLNDDIIRMVNTAISTEVLVGCQIVIEAGSHWAKPCFTDWHQLDDYDVRETIWYRRLMTNTEAAVEALGDDTYPFCCMVHRGAVDMAMAMMTAERLCLEVTDHPAELKNLLARITDIIIETASAHADRLPCHQHGQFNHFGVWTPGRTVLFTVDAAWMFSPACYEEFFLPCDMRVCEAFDTPLVHLHSAARTHFPSWSAIPNLGLQCSVDEVRVDADEIKAIGPSLPELIPAFKAVRRESSLMVHGFWDEERVALANRELAGNGTAIRGQVDGPESYRQRWVHYRD